MNSKLKLLITIILFFILILLFFTFFTSQNEKRIINPQITTDGINTTLKCNIDHIELSDSAAKELEIVITKDSIPVKDAKIVVIRYWGSEEAELSVLEEVGFTNEQGIVVSKKVCGYHRFMIILNSGDIGVFFLEENNNTAKVLISLDSFYKISKCAKENRRNHSEINIFCL